MYANPKHLHDREIKGRIDEDAFDLIHALAVDFCTRHALPCCELVTQPPDKMNYA